MTIQKNIIAIMGTVLAVAFAVAVTAIVVPTFAQALGGDSGCCDNGGSGGYSPPPFDYSPPTYNPPTYNPPPSPFCTLSITPSTVQYGGTAYASWSSSNATSASINQGIGTVPVNGSKTLANLTVTKTYTLTVSGPGGTATCRDTVIVQPQTPRCTLTRNPSSIQSGGSSTLSWTSTNATSASINQGIGSVGLNSSRSVSPTVTTTYTLTVTGAGGTVTCHTIVTVTQPQPPSCTLSANPHNVQYGGSSTLSWTSQNATSASINQGIGSVGVNGSYTVSNLTSTKTYTLTVTGPGGTATCQKTITVQQQQAPSCTLTTNLSSIQYGGSFTLSWSSTNATSASIDQGIGNVGVNGTYVVSNVTTTKTYTLTVTGPGGTANCQTTIIVQQPQTPSCTLSANPHSVQYGGSATITWSSQNATSATLTDFGSEPINGSRAISNITANKTYTLTVTGPGGTATCQDNIVVQQQPLPSCTITVNPHSAQTGGSATITWSSQNATSATLTDFGSEPVNGSRTVSNITSNKTYVLTVTGPGGTATCQDSVVVQESPAPYCTINANPSSLQYGGSSTLTWSSTNATSATINQGIGSVAINGSYVVSNIITTKTYTMTVTGPGGTATCQTTIYVSEIPSNPSCTLNANPTSIQSGGSSHLSWTSQNATSATLSSVGSVGVNGSQTVYPNGTTTYILTVYGSQGQSAQCQTTVNVGTVYNNPPSCWITISQYNQYNYNNNYNQQATLSWGSTNATSASINPNIGSISTSGSQTVYLSGNQVYTMTVYNAQGQSATCQTQSTYVPPPPTYYPPQVALTQIPYTGLDLGTTGTMLYYLALLSFAVAAGYLIIYYVPAFAGIKARIPAETMEAPMIFARSVAASVPFTRASRSTNSSESTFKDSMTFARSENGTTPRIVIQRN